MNTKTTRECSPGKLEEVPVVGWSVQGQFLLSRRKGSEGKMNFSLLSLCVCGQNKLILSDQSGGGRLLGRCRYAYMRLEERKLLLGG